MSKSKNRGPLGIVLATCAVLAVAGCSGSDSSSDRSSSDDAVADVAASVPTTAAQPTPPPSLSEVSSAFYGATIRRPFQFGPEGQSAAIVIEMLPGQVGPNIIHFAFLDQGQRAVSIQDLELGLRSSKGTTPLPAAPLQDAGHYATQVTFARAGSWELTVQFKPSATDDAVTEAVPVSVQ